MKGLWLACMVCVAVLGDAHAQSNAPQDQGRPSAGSRDPYVTSTGETVDKPGQSQSAGTTRLDQKIQREDNMIDKGICNGC